MFPVCSIVFLTMLHGNVFGAPQSGSARSWEENEYYNDNILTPSNDCDCVCGMSNRQIRVVGGNVTKVNEFPWLAGISRNGKFLCGATVLTRRHLLTAAHCIVGLDYRSMMIAFGDHDRNDKDRFKNIQVRSIKKVSTHKFFDKTSYNNDIAVLEIDSPLLFDSKIQPACLPHSAAFDYSGQWAVVAGWGRTGEKEETSTILKKVVVPIWTKKNCYNSGYGEDRLSENMFCAGYEEGKVDACQLDNVEKVTEVADVSPVLVSGFIRGDSGGPLHVKNREGIMDVVGIVSWGRGCARPNLPGVYTKVVNYLDWILQKLDGECLCPPPNQNPRRA